MKRLHYDGKAENWAEVYQSPDTFGQKIQRRRDAVVAAVQGQLGDRKVSILDAGCGTGAVSRQLRSIGHRVTGVDVSQEMLVTARRQTSECGLSVEFSRGSLMALPFGSASFDAAVCVGVLGHYPLRRGSGNFEEDDVLGLREVVRVLRPGGFIVLTLPNLYRLHWLLDPVQLRRAFEHRRLLLALEAGARDGKSAPPASKLGQEPATRHQTPSEMLRLIRGEGLEVLGLDGVGFGPFTILGRPLFSNERSVRISAKMERIAQGPVFSPLNRFAGTWVLTLRPERAASTLPPLPAGAQSSAR